MASDLHMHTTCSDGVYSPEELVEAAKAAGRLMKAVLQEDKRIF